MEIFGRRFRLAGEIDKEKEEKIIMNYGNVAKAEYIKDIIAKETGQQVLEVKREQI